MAEAQFAPQIKQAESVIAGAQEARKGIEGQIDTEFAGEKARQETRIAETDPLIKGFQSEIAKPMPEIPQQQAITQYQPKQVSANEMMDFGAMAMGFASLAALGTRGGITAALNGAAGAMKGYSDGNIVQAKLEMEQHDQTMKAALAQNKQLMDSYNAVMQRRDMSLNEKLQEMRVIAARNKDEAGLAALRMGQLQHFWDRNSKLVSETQNMEYKWMSLQQQAYDHAQQRATTIQAANIAASSRVGNQPSNMTKDALDDAAAYLILNGRIPMGMARAYGKGVLEEIQNRASEMRVGLGMSSFDAAAAGPITRAKVASLLDFEKKRNNLQSFERMLELNVGVLKDLSKTVERTDSPYVNKTILWLKQNAQGDPAVADYLMQVNVVQQEAARIMNNPNLTGELPEGARKDMQAVIRGELNPDQLSAVLDRTIVDSKNRSKGLDEQRAKIIKEIRDPLGTSGGGGATQDIKAAVERSGGVYDPSKYEYRIGANGQVQRRAK